MRILLVNTYGRSGGASVAAHRLGAALSAQGMEVGLLVQNCEGCEDFFTIKTGDTFAKYRPLLDALPTIPWRNRRTPHWSNAWLGNRSTMNAIEEFRPDIIHLHWVNHGMLSVRNIAALKRPVVWTLHDSWAFTGGCHSPQGCTRYRQQCGACPELRSRKEHDLSRQNWRLKANIWRDVEFTVITPSKWLAEAVRSSSLFSNKHIEVIPNSVDTTIFKPQDRTAARASMNLPTDAKVFLFGANGAATDWNKGIDLWRATLPIVSNRFPDAIALVAGIPEGRKLPEGPLQIHNLGVLNPSQMALAMTASDAVVIPSRMENLPNMAVESLACGTPVAAFSVGGIPEIVVPESTGLLADPHNIESLADCICGLLAEGDKMRETCVSATLARYAPKLVAREHIQLYKSVAL